MPYATNSRVKIYYEVEGQGPPLVLVHGRGGSLQAWRRHGYPDALKNDHRLVLIDARGHGQSEKPQEPAAYSLPVMAEDVVAVLDDLGIDQTRYFGYSMGGRIGYWLATHHAERFCGLILGGSSPRSDAREIGFQQQIMEMLNLLVEDPQAALLKREQLLGRSLTADETGAFLASDARALLALAAAVARSPQVTDHELSLVPLPCLVLVGGLDLAYAGAREAAAHMLRGEFVSLPGLDHSQTFERSDLVVPYVEKFLAELRGSN